MGHMARRLQPSPDPCSTLRYCSMGFNPYRKFRAKPSDYVFVVAGVLVAAALVTWAFLG
jgi:hypothetical protein